MTNPLLPATVRISWVIFGLMDRYIKTYGVNPDRVILGRDVARAMPGISAFASYPVECLTEEGQADMVWVASLEREGKPGGAVARYVNMVGQQWKGEAG